MRIDQDKISKYVKRANLISKLFIKNVQIFNEENLEKLKEKKILFNSNHLSYWDIIEYTKMFNSHGLNQPYFIAANHLDNFPTNKFMNESTGAIFIDRNIAKEGSNEEKLKLKEKNAKQIEEIVSGGYGFFPFLEGGFRNNEKGNPMKNIKLSFPRDYIREIIRQGKNPEEYFGFNLTINYLEKSIEEPFSERSKQYKKEIEFCVKKIREASNSKERRHYEKKQKRAFKKYFVTDLFAYASQPFRKKPIVKINLGEPYSLKEYLKPGGWLELGKFIQEDVKRLYKKIS